MGAGSVCFQRPGRSLVVRVGREEEGVSSLRPELAAIARTLQATSQLEVDLLTLVPIGRMAKGKGALDWLFRTAAPTRSLNSVQHEREFRACAC